jgi:hypothetical protein
MSTRRPPVIAVLVPPPPPVVAAPVAVAPRRRRRDLPIAESPLEDSPVAHAPLPTRRDLPPDLLPVAESPLHDLPVAESPLEDLLASPSSTATEELLRVVDMLDVLADDAAGPLLDRPAGDDSQKGKARSSKRNVLFDLDAGDDAAKKMRHNHTERCRIVRLNEAFDELRAELRRATGRADLAMPHKTDVLREAVAVLRTRAPAQEER